MKQSMKNMKKKFETNIMPICNFRGYFQSYKVGTIWYEDVSPSAIRIKTYIYFSVCMLIWLVYQNNLRE